MVGDSPSDPRVADAPDPVFLIGAPRSGTSLLYRALSLHPEAAWISNWVRRAPALPYLAALNRMTALVPEERRRVWFGEQGDNAYRYGAARPVVERLFPQPVEGEPIFTRAGIAVTPAAGPPDRVAGRRLAASLGAIRRWSGGRRLLVKRIANNIRIPLLAAAFPGALFVDVLRDGRAVAVSLRRVDWWATSLVWWYGGTPQDWEADGRDPWELCARHWIEEVRAIDEATAALPAAQVIRLRYEDLVEEPLPHLRRIAGACGFDPDDAAWCNALEQVAFPQHGEDRWRAVGSDVVSTIERVQADLLRQKGYA